MAVEHKRKLEEYSPDSPSGLEWCRPQKIDLSSVEYLPGELLRAVEDRLIREVLKLTKGNKTRAAKILGISVRTLRYKTSSKEGR